ALRLTVVPLHEIVIDRLPVRAALASELATVRRELLEERPQGIDLLLVLESGKRHLRSRQPDLRVSDVFLERLLVPDDAGRLVCFGIFEPLYRAGRAANEAVEGRRRPAARSLPDHMAGRAFPEHEFARADILRRGGTHRYGGEQHGHWQNPHPISPESEG